MSDISLNYIILFEKWFLYTNTNIHPPRVLRSPFRSDTKKFNTCNKYYYNKNLKKKNRISRENEITDYRIIYLISGLTRKLLILFFRYWEKIML